MLTVVTHLFRNYFKHNNPENKDSSDDDPGNKVTPMEKKISDLEEENKKLMLELEYSKDKEYALQEIVCNYDNLLKKVVLEKTQMTQKQHSPGHVVNLEKAFCELLQKYEKAKVVVHGFQQNETIMKRQLKEYEKMLEEVKIAYNKYKAREVDTPNEANKSGKTLAEKMLKKNKTSKKRRLLTTM